MPPRQRQVTQAQRDALARGRATAEANRRRQKLTDSPSSPQQPTPAAAPAPTPAAAAPRPPRPAQRNRATLIGGLAPSLADELGLPVEAAGATADPRDELGASDAGDPESSAAAPAPAAAAADQPEADDGDGEGDGEGAGVDPAAIAAVFESVAGTPGDPTQRQRSATAAAGRSRIAQRRASRKAKRGSSTTAGKSSTTPRATPAQRKEQEVEAAAEQWYDDASTLLIFALTLFVGRDLAPSEEQADAISAPLIRILMRHYDPLRKASADSADLVAAGIAFALYAQAVYPTWNERRQQKRMAQHVKQQPAPRQQQQQQQQQQQRVPIVVNGTAIANPGSDRRAAVTASGPAGLRTDAFRSGGGAYEPEPSGRDGYRPEDVLAEVSGYAVG